MRKHDQPFKPLSLAQHFEAPDDFVGSFGWLCGYSADVGFLDDAVERFTRRTHAQRAYEGRIAMALMLDPSNPQILPKEVPGVLHLPMTGVPLFRLLHAKVALIGFRHTTDARQWQLRLIVSTGNWTRQTLEESLDLAWRLDLSDQDVKARDDSASQACADVKAAWNMLAWLQRHFDFRALHATPPGRQGSEDGSANVERWIAKAIRSSNGVAPRFFDNRDASLLAQLPALIQEHTSHSARNYLGMGSGFYESSDNHNKIPPVLKHIVDDLLEAGLLTQRPEIDIFVNPKACQAVANSVPSFNHVGWNVREAGQPEYFKASRSLHAKFIFSANYRDNSPFCNSAWLYLGSGNLTGPGFANKMARHLGNLEAGVVFDAESLCWEPARGVSPEAVVTNVLPLQWETDFSEDSESLAAGSDMPEPEIQYSAAPVAYLFWIVEGSTCWLRAGEEGTESFDLLDETGHACQRDSIKGFQWLGARPRQVLIRWRMDEQERQAWVPVIDEFGRIAATALPRIDIDEAWGQLASFPMPPADEELLPDGDGASMDDAAQQGAGGSVAASYPVRQMMQLIENIAAKQTSVCQADWVTWCTRFEQCLIQAAGSKVLEEFVKLDLNPLSPLWHSPFRPAFAATNETAEGVRYESVLKRVETAWNVAGLGRIGDQI